MEAHDLLNILVIDDDEEMRQLIAQILLSSGHQVYSVGSAEEGLELLPYSSIQIAFLDQNLPGMEGLVLGEYLRRNNPHMSIALVTGSDDPRLGRIYEERGIRLIRKPFQITEILDIVSEYQREAADRLEDRLKKEDIDYDLHLEPYFEHLDRCFELPAAPQRILERLERRVRDALTELRSVSRYNEQARAVAYSGIICLKILSDKLPKNADGKNLAEAFDEAMVNHGRKAIFTSGQDDSETTD